MPLLSTKDLLPGLIAMRDDDDKIYIDNGYLILNYEYEYDIAFDRIKTAEDVLGWVFHLASKNWMNTHRLQNFICKCGEINNKDYTQCG